MATVPLLRMAVTAHGSPAARLQMMVRARSAHPEANLRYQLSVTAQLVAAAAARSRVIGVAVDIDRGDGVLSRLAERELGDTITIGGSLDGYGRTASFVRYDAEEISPLVSAWLRRLNEVRIYGYLGVPGTMQRRTVFRGFMHQGSFTAEPPTGRLDCQDASVRFAEQRLAYNLAPGSLKSRGDVLREICASYGVAVGSWDLGPNDGGLVFKGITVGADVRLLDWIRDFLTPIGRRLRFNEATGAMDIARFDGSGPVRRRLDARVLGQQSLQMTPPSTNAANVVSISSTVFGYIGPTGTHTEVKVVATPGTYTPAVAVKKQDRATGVVSALAITPSTATEVSKVITTSTYAGGTLTEQVIEEWGWYAPRACNARQTSAGAITFNNAFDVYQYADGSWRAEPQETYRVIRRSRLQRLFSDTSGFLYEEDTTVKRYRAAQIPRGSFDIFTNAPIYDDVLVTSDGIAWLGGVEVMMQFRTTRVIAAGGDRRLSWVLTEGNVAGFMSYESPAGFGAGAVAYNRWTKPAVPTGSGNTVYFFGPAERQEYGVRPAAALNSAGWWSYGAVMETYSQVSETQHAIDAVARSAGAAALWVGFDDLPLPVTPGHREVPGSIPLVDILTARQTAQLATAVMKDSVRIALSTSETDVTYQNDFCETLDELVTVALEHMRELSAITATATVPVDWDLREGDVVEIAGPCAGSSPKRMTVWSTEYSFNSAIAENTQQLTLRYLPPEVAATN